MGYGDSDYDPVGIYDDEEEQLRRAGYAPAMPSAATDAAAPPPVESSYAPAAPSRAPEPAVGSLDDLESRAAHPSYPAVAADQPQRPQWKDYAPAEPHGWSKFGHFMAGLTAPTDYFFNERPLEQATRGYKAATAEYEAPFAEHEKESQTAEHEAAAERDRATAAAAGQPKPKEEKWSEFTGYTDTDNTPLMREENSGQVVRASDKRPPTGFKAAAPKTDKPDNPQQQLIDAEAAVVAAKTPEERDAARAKVDQLKKAISDYAATSQRPDKPGAGNARSDKSYTYNNDKLDKLGKPLEDAVARMGRLRESLAQNTPQADALVAPELLTVMAGGAGSGLRMNEAEISRIVGGRSKWETLKASVNQWQLDPTKANSITPEQRQQIRGLVDAVSAKLLKKQQALDAAREGLLDTDDPKEHRRIVTDAHHALSQVDEEAPAEKKTVKIGGQDIPVGADGTFDYQGHTYRDNGDGKGATLVK